MDRMLYIAMTGARNALQAQATNSNNLANADTTGFKKDIDAFRDKPVYGPGHATRVYAEDERAGVDYAPGPLNTTGRDLDIAIQGQGWLVVQAPDGSEALTRAGDLRFSATGLLTTGAGHLVLGEGGPIALPPSDKVEIGDDGTISAVPQGQAPNNLVVIDRIRLVNPDQAQVQKGPDGLFRYEGEEPLVGDAGVKITTGALEGSNVNPVDAMVKMIEHARMFELQTKVMKTADDNEAATNRVMGLG